MKPTAPLMIEHRLIDRMLVLFGRTHLLISKTGTVQSAFLGAILEFFRVYVDRFHHGKEEDILFRDLATRQLHAADLDMMNELIAEHGNSRAVLQRLEQAVGSGSSRRETVQAITADMEKLLAWYPVHIRKEDRRFFPAALRYLDPAAQSAMLEELREFDRNFTQQQYRTVVEDLEARFREAA